MSKTPEEMAEELCADIDLCCGTSDIIIAAEKAFKAGYKAAQDQSPDATKWISVKDRLPEDYQNCLFYVDWIDVWDKGSERITYQEIGVFNGKDCFYHRAHTDLKKVTHWMALPEAPKEGE